MTSSRILLTLKGFAPKVASRTWIQSDFGARWITSNGRHTKYYQGVFSWNGAKGQYESNSPQLKTLAKFNRDRL